MKVSRDRPLFLIPCLALTFFGCGQNNEPESAPNPPAAITNQTLAEAEKQPPPTEAPWACPPQPGTAPTGELVAERIPAANSSRAEAGLFEGPVWLDNALYFSDFIFTEGSPSRVQKLTLDGTVTTAIADSGSNGLAVDAEGQLLAATHDKKAISRYNLATGARAIVVAEYEGSPFNSPNDLVQADDGTLYFTDPDFQRGAAASGQELTRVYRFDGQNVSVVDDSIINPNGIALSPAQTTLYVAGGNVLRAYPITDGVVGAGEDLTEVNGPDGMAVDCLGNLYVTEHGQQRLRVISPAGVDLATITVDANVTNAAFGGPERKTLYITGAGAVWKLDLDVAGLPY